MKTTSIIFAVFIFFSPPLLAEKGVAFVHGTGDNNDALNDYWTSSMVNSVVLGLPNPSNFVVINCDFDAFMWTSGAAGCLASQLTSFINNNNINDMIVISHSNGGNVMRWILSNPTWDSRFPAIINATSKVTAIAPSSLGTPLANAATNGNIFETILGWILGFQTDAVKMQQTSWMAYYNSVWLLGTSGRPALPVPFRNVVGSDVESAVWDSDSYCAGYANQVALEFTQNWLDSCSDGFLNCSSQSGAGSVWFVDKSRTKSGEPLSHQQSRRNCFNLDTILRNDL